MLRKDFETGETIEVNYNKNCSSTQRSEFESINDCDHSNNAFDRETGELHNRSRVQSPTGNFHVPKALLTRASARTRMQYGKGAAAINRYCRSLTQTPKIYTLTNRDKVIHLQEEIILGYNKTSHRLFLIPSLFVFFKLTAILVVLIEVVLHVWAHQKNKHNRNPKIYYRSPLHVVSAQFCAICRSVHSMDRVSQIQERRSKTHQHQFNQLDLHQVTRSIT